MARPRIPMSRQLAEGDKSKVGKGVLRAKLAAEPHPQSGLPPAPEYLPERAREAYEFWRAELRLMQLDHRPDGPALAAAALAYSRAIEAEMLIMREGVIVKDAIFY